MVPVAIPLWWGLGYWRMQRYCVSMVLEPSGGTNVDNSVYGVIEKLHECIGELLSDF